MNKLGIKIIVFAFLWVSILGCSIPRSFGPKIAVRKEIYFAPQLDLVWRTKLLVSYIYFAPKREDISLTKQAAKIVFNELQRLDLFEDVEFFDNVEQYDLAHLLVLARAKGFKSFVVVKINPYYFEGDYLSDSFLEENIKLYYLEINKNTLLVQANLIAKGNFCPREDFFLFQTARYPAASLRELIQTNAQVFAKSLAKQSGLLP